MNDMRDEADKVYQQLNDWTLLQLKAEFDAAHQIQLQLSQAAEGERRVGKLLEVSNSDAFEQQGKQLFMAPMKKLLDAREVPRDYRFTVEQLEALVDAVGTQAFSTVQSLTTTLNNAKNASKEGLETLHGVPHSWVECSNRDVAQAVQTLDPLATGLVNTRKFL